MAKHFEKGNAGRPKGSKNKVPSDLRDIVISVAGSLHEDGLEAALKEWALKGRNETIFWTKMVAPLMPKIVEGNIQGITIKWDDSVDGI